MKLVRYGAQGAEKPGLIDATGRVRDLSGVVPDIAGDTLRRAGLRALHDLDIESLPWSTAPRRRTCVSAPAWAKSASSSASV